MPKLLKSPNSTNIVCFELDAEALGAKEEEVLDPGVGFIKLAGTPIVEISKTTNHGSLKVQ